MRGLGGDEVGLGREAGASGDMESGHACGSWVGVGGGGRSDLQKCRGAL